MVSYLSRIPAGIAGMISRTADITVESQLINPSKPFLAFGVFGKFVSNRVEPLEAADAATVITGIVARTYPSQSANNAFGPGTPPTSGFIDFVRRGYMSVFLRTGTAAKGGQVFVVTTAGGPNLLNDIVTSASPAGGGTAVAVPNCFFTGPADANGITEIAFNI